ncbi:hypothetical protein QMZ05_05075 [Bradyrhizobium sp. INPA03-11B]|uniref:hypothetical protein n=1 Tax=Bradyrhizobium sp. INPA03-11B TaxID=418598 RepID=UPI00338D4A4B
MTEQLAGFPFWEPSFDEDGRTTNRNAIDKAVSEIVAENLTDLFVFSHGWNNDRSYARSLYEGFFKQVRLVLDNAKFMKKRNPKAGILGIFWPSILWPDEVPAAQGGGEAAAVARPKARAQVASVDDLANVFKQADRAEVERLHSLLTERKRDEAALKEFFEQLRSVMSKSSRSPSPEDSLERDAIENKPDQWRDILKQLSTREQPQTRGGAAGVGDELGKLWDGAKGALRIATYWQMKERAGVVGQAGLGPLLSQLAAAKSDMACHLIGHSFGARLVSFALSGLQGEASPVKSLLLIQGAFSHFTFAPTLPFDPNRSGELHEFARKVDGPLVTTFSGFDFAVGRAYPLASFLGHQDASGLDDNASRWGAMGNDGAQAVGAVTSGLVAAGRPYSFQNGKWHNLDGNKVIKTGGLPSGAHSDILHPEVAWACLSAAGIA